MNMPIYIISTEGEVKYLHSKAGAGSKLNSTRWIRVQHFNYTLTTL